MNFTYTYWDAYSYLAEPVIAVMLLALCIPLIWKRSLHKNPAILFLTLILITLIHMFIQYHVFRDPAWHLNIGWILFLAFGTGYSLLISRERYQGKRCGAFLVLFVCLLLMTCFMLILSHRPGLL